MQELVLILWSLYMFGAGMTVAIHYRYFTEALPINNSGEMAVAIFLSIMAATSWPCWVPFYLLYKLLTK